MNCLCKQKNDFRSRILIVLATLVLSFVTVFAIANVTNLSEKVIVHAEDDSDDDDTPAGCTTGKAWEMVLDANGNVVRCGDLADNTDAVDSWNKLGEKFRFFVMGVTGISTIAMVLFFVYSFLKLGSTFDNDGARSKVLKGLIWSAIAAAGLGSVTVFVGFFLDAAK